MEDEVVEDDVSESERVESENALNKRISGFQKLFKDKSLSSTKKIPP